MTYALFGSAANRYDWHTPPHHYQDDHNFVLSRLPKPPARVLDVGCGTGVFLEKAISAGFDATGLDASEEMVSLAAGRVGSARVRLERMQDLAESEVYDAIVSLSWSFNYLDSDREAEEVLKRFFQALKPSGQLILQIAHAPNATGKLNEDREAGSEGQADDVLFLYRFSHVADPSSGLRAQYVYGCRSRDELLFEEHELNAADARKVGSWHLLSVSNGLSCSTPTAVNRWPSRLVHSCLRRADKTSIKEVDEAASQNTTKPFDESPKGRLPSAVPCRVDSGCCER